MKKKKISYIFIILIMTLFFSVPVYAEDNNDFVSPYDVEAGDYIVMRYNPTNTYYYFRVLSLEPFFYYQYFHYDMTKKVMTTDNAYKTGPMTFYQYYVDEIEQRDILYLIKNNSDVRLDNINFDNVDLSVDNTEIIEKIDKIETSVYIIIFVLSAFFGAFITRIFTRVISKI